MTFVNILPVYGSTFNYFDVIDCQSYRIR